MNLMKTALILALSVIKVLGIQLCGRQLADMLDLVCSGRGFHWINTDGAPRISKRTAAQFLSVSTSISDTLQQRGIVTECCRRSCGYETMESYCAAPSGSHVPNPTPAPLTPDIASRLLESNARVLLTDRPSTRRPHTTPQPTTTTTTTARPSPKPERPIIHRPFPSFIYVRPIGPIPTRTPVV